MKIIYLEMIPSGRPEMPGSLRKVELSRGIFFQPKEVHIPVNGCKGHGGNLSKVIFRTCVYTNLDSFYSK